MHRTRIFYLFLLLSPTLCRAQVGGNIGYAQSGASARAEQNERARRILTREEMPPTPRSMFVEASVLLNRKADEYVALFGVMQEGKTVAECSQKMDATISAFTTALKPLGIGPADLFVDFAAQNRIYAYEVTGEIAQEKVTGFELKKNVSVHYRDKQLLDRLVLAAAQVEIYDLIKVDYVVKDITAEHNRLMQEAARIIHRKADRYRQLLGIRLLPPAQVYAERTGAYFPSEMYDSYTAYESEQVNAGVDRQRYVIQNARKSRTFFFNALNARGFDSVLNPVVLEPVVQFTLYLKVKYEIAPVSQKPAAGTGARAVRVRGGASKRTEGRAGRR